LRQGSEFIGIVPQLVRIDGGSLIQRRWHVSLALHIGLIGLANARRDWATLREQGGYTEENSQASNQTNHGDLQAGRANYRMQTLEILLLIVVRSCRKNWIRQDRKRDPSGKNVTVALTP
jgi:hypothetical protein